MLRYVYLNKVLFIPCDAALIPEGSRGSARRWLAPHHHGGRGSGSPVSSCKPVARPETSEDCVTDARSHVRRPPRTLRRMILVYPCACTSPRRPRARGRILSARSRTGAAGSALKALEMARRGEPNVGIRERGGSLLPHPTLSEDRFTAAFGRRSCSCLIRGGRDASYFVPPNSSS